MLPYMLLQNYIYPSFLKVKGHGSPRIRALYVCSYMFPSFPPHTKETHKCIMYFIHILIISYYPKKPFCCSHSPTRQPWGQTHTPSCIQGTRQFHSDINPWKWYDLNHYLWFCNHAAKWKYEAIIFKQNQRIFQSLLGNLHKISYEKEAIFFSECKRKGRKRSLVKSTIFKWSHVKVRGFTKPPLLPLSYMIKIIHLNNLFFLLPSPLPEGII